MQLDQKETQNDQQQTQNDHKQLRNDPKNTHRNTKYTKNYYKDMNYNEKQTHNDHKCHDGFICSSVASGDPIGEVGELLPVCAYGSISSYSVNSIDSSMRTHVITVIHELN